ncbi:MAG: hypothetical protein ACP5QT_03725 [Brevinematia bacterium]
MPHSEKSGHRKVCSVCGKEDALVFLKIIKNNVVEERGFCARCALHYLENSTGKLDFTHIDDKILNSLTQVRDLIGYIIKGVEVAAKTKSYTEAKEEICSHCGITFKGFTESGFLGCPYCYTTFRKKIKDYIMDFERGVQHKGRMPKKYVSLFLVKKEIMFLMNKIKRLLLNENYEEAEKVKKRLEKLIGTYPINYEDELY